jgi:hypothetical protein
MSPKSKGPIKSDKSDNNESDNTSPIMRATAELSPDMLFKLSRRYQRMASKQLRRNGHSSPAESVAHQSTERLTATNNGRELNSPNKDKVATVADPVVHFQAFTQKGEGSSHPKMNKGKGVDPGNWGGVELSENFSDDDFEAQRQAFENFAEINRVIKEEERSTPDGFFDQKSPIDLVSPGPSAPVVVSSSAPRTKEGNESGQTKSERIASLKRELSELEQDDVFLRPIVKIPSSRAQQAVKNSLEDKIRKSAPGKPSKKQSVRPEKVRIAVGSSIEKAIRESAGNKTDPPPSDSSHGSSSSSSDNEPDRSAAEDEGKQRMSTSQSRDRSHSKRSQSSRTERESRMILKPIPPTKYEGLQIPKHTNGLYARDQLTLKPVGYLKISRYFSCLTI